MAGVCLAAACLRDFLDMGESHGFWLRQVFGHTAELDSTWFVVIMEISTRAEAFLNPGLGAYRSSGCQRGWFGVWLAADGYSKRDIE